jgi:hypothetical protein
MIYDVNVSDLFGDRIQTISMQTGFPRKVSTVDLIMAMGAESYKEALSSMVAMTVPPTYPKVFMDISDAIELCELLYRTFDKTKTRPICTTKLLARLFDGDPMLKNITKKGYLTDAELADDKEREIHRIDSEDGVSLVNHKLEKNREAQTKIEKMNIIYHKDLADKEERYTWLCNWDKDLLTSRKARKRTIAVVAKMILDRVNKKRKREDSASSDSEDSASSTDDNC